jgi:hypothetical protein
MSRHLSSAMLLIVAIIHLLPLIGALSASRLTSLYGIAFDEPNLEILMRHRAVLFGLLGGFFALAAWRQALQTLAYGAGFASVLSFLLMAWTVGGYNAQLSRVFAADLVALGCLLVGAAARAFAPSGPHD